MGFNFLSYLFMTVLIPAVSFSQNITRLDDSKISLVELDQKVQQLMKDGNVHGLAITVFNHNRPVYKKVFGYKRLIQKNLYKQTLISMVHP